MLFGEYPVQVTCGNCCRTIVTKTRTARGFCTYLAAYIVCIVCCPCVLIPLCSKECKDVHHFCPSCGTMLGVYRRI
ncbi:LITAF domain-containing protein [Caerostris extrusa]|uniref:LITAF domain-containing protein n=1 Tax=Caerostris extrusa TaxID=172846 RepID=A0AAV4WE30_CAEEX|nr:LITAF domain-containing protein [Caerostris extrusa]